MSELSLPQFPALYWTAPVGPGKRVLRGVLSGLIVGAVAAAVAAVIVLAADLAKDLVVVQGVVVGCLAAVAAVAAVLDCLAGGWLPDAIVGTRLVRVADGRTVGASGFGRLALVGLLAAATAGLANLVLTVLGRDSNGRVWLDRVTGTAMIDIRAGRNVLVDPVSSAELERALRPEAPPRPAVVEVRGGSGEPKPMPLEAHDTLASLPDEVVRLGGIGPGYLEGDPTVVSGMRTSAPPPLPAPAWLLTFDTGESHRLHGTALIGRHPVAHSGHRGAELVKVADPSATMSGTHLAITANDVGVWVEDLGSTNGSEIRLPSGRKVALPVRVRTPVAKGSRVRLGDRWMTVERAPE